MYKLFYQALKPLEVKDGYQPLEVKDGYHVNCTVSSNFLLDKGRVAPC